MSESHPPVKLLIRETTMSIIITCSNNLCRDPLHWSLILLPSSSSPAPFMIQTIIHGNTQNISDFWNIDNVSHDAPFVWLFTVGDLGTQIMILWHDIFAGGMLLFARGWCRCHVTCHACHKDYPDNYLQCACPGQICHTGPYCDVRLMLMSRSWYGW